MINEETARVCETLANTACKVLIVLVMLGLAIVLASCLLLNPSPYLTVVISLLPFTLRIVMKHFFYPRDHSHCTQHCFTNATGTPFIHSIEPACPACKQFLIVSVTQPKQAVETPPNYDVRNY